MARLLARQRMVMHDERERADSPMSPCTEHRRCWTFEGVHHTLDKVETVWNEHDRESHRVYVHSADCKGCMQEQEQTDD